MQLEQNRPYKFNAAVIYFVRSFSTRRGTFHRFRYANGSCVDIYPGDVSQVREIPDGLTVVHKPMITLTGNS